MLSKKMEQAINEQINAEFYSSYLYLAMSAHLKDTGLHGCAAWMEAQTEEEWFHGMKIYGYLCERGSRITLKAIAQPPAKWQSCPAVFTDVLKHEQEVTRLINNLVNLAQDEGDHASNVFLQWFIEEQVEEEATAKAILDKLKLIGDDTHSLFILDKELGQRVFTPPDKS